jgi:hypothetical protein
VIATFSTCTALLLASQSMAGSRHKLPSPHRWPRSCSPKLPEAGLQPSRSGSIMSLRSRLVTGRARLRLPFAAGQDHYGVIFWLDESGDQSRPPPTWPQIFGLTSVLRPQRAKSWIIREGKVAGGAPWINLNTVAVIWVYDADRDEIADIR